MGAPLVAHDQRHVMILVFGILSICVVFLFGPFAWVLGRRELARIDRGELPREGRGAAQAGMICGIVGCGIGLLQLLWIAYILLTFFR